jgi:parallel beta-helix repeat protein
MSRNLRITRLGKICLTPVLAYCTVGGLASAATLCVNHGGTGGCTSTISAAVALASPGDTIQVGPGVYKEQVTITKQLALVALDGSKPPTIDATGLPNGVFINGMSAAPAAGVYHVVVSGFKIHNANFEGILIVNASDTIIVGNHVLDNNKALDLSTSPASCPGIPTWFETNEQMDCGEGIHLMSSDRSTIIQNEVNGNSGGILITDETGPTQLNVISGNFVHDNGYACGITMASHGPATAVIPTAKVSFGIYHNTVTNNESAHNGLGLPGAGAGVGIFAAGPGYRSSENVVINNFLHGNGLPGVTMHNHAAVPGIPVPPADLDNNVIIGNIIANNAADTEDAMTAGPTGINIFSLVPVHGTVISQNVFEDEAIDFAFNAPAVSDVDAHFNNFSAGSIGVDNLGGGHVSPTNNWWHCPSGPTGPGCATAVGNVGVVLPWLTSPFVP